MKKLLFLLAIGALLTAPALAQPGTPPPAGAYEVEMFYMHPDGTPVDGVGHLGELDQLARCFASMDQEGNCNKKFWRIPVIIHASVGQWIDWWMTGTRWDWYIKKPGCYAADCITAHIASNGDILVDYDGFGNLVNADGREIEISYAFGGSITDASNNGWVPGPALDDDDDLLEESTMWYNVGTIDEGNYLHDGITWKLWNMICVVDCNTACEYEDEAEIILTLNQQKDWIDQDEESNTYGTYLPGWFSIAP